MKTNMKLGRFRIFRTHGRYGKKLYEFTPELNGEFRGLYEKMLCLTKMRHQEAKYLPSKMRSSKTHMKKILKQNSYKDKFDQELEREIKTTDGSFAVKLQEVRADNRNKQ